MNKRLRILAFNWRCLRHPQAGGAEINLFEQARRWVQDGHEVTVVTSDPGRAYVATPVDDIDGISVRRMGGRFTVYLFAVLFLLRAFWKFDRIVDVANGIPFFTPLFTRRAGVLIIHHVCGEQWFTEFPRPIAVIGSFLERRIVPWVYRRWSVITVSPTTRDALLALGFAESQISIVYNGIEAPIESPMSLPQAKYRVAYVGRLKRYKRIDLLVRAVAALRPHFPNIQLDLAGDGDARADIEALVTELELQDCVTIYGFVDAPTKAAILSSATVFATPSMHEGWGISVIEANAYGCPAVAFDVPGLSVAIRHDETGMLAADDEAFRNALAAILSDQAMRDRLSVGARNWASRFDWSASAAMTLTILQTCA